MEFLILDGGLATQLEDRGHDLTTSLWSARLLNEAPDEIRAVHRAYLAAGADCITSASYQATIEGFVSTDMSIEQAHRLIRRSVTLAKSERDRFWAETTSDAGRRRPLVAASIGPYGAFLANGAEFTGDYGMDERQLVDFHRQRWQLLASESPDVMLCETIPTLGEARALALLATDTPQLTTWLSFSCRNASQTCDGTRIEACARFVDQHPNVAAIGVNCTAPRYIGELILRIRAATEKPIFVYPNSGETFDGISHSWRGASDVENFTQLALAWRSLGVQSIGGCCRTTPAHIRAIRKALKP